jgi:hypothetical protein
MIGKISLGTSFSRCINYCLEDKNRNNRKRQFLKTGQNRLRLITAFGDKKELIEQFNDVRGLNQKVQKPVKHTVLSLAGGEQLKKGKLAEMASECAKQMGFDKN